MRYEVKNACLFNAQVGMISSYSQSLVMAVQGELWKCGFCSS